MSTAYRLTEGFSAAPCTRNFPFLIVPHPSFRSEHQSPLRPGRGKTCQELNIPQNVARYVQTVLDEEWHLLAEKRLSDKAWAAYVAVEMALLRLEPSSDYERELRREMLDDWDQGSEYRRGREAASARAIPTFFWSLAILGFVCVVMPYSVFAAGWVNVLMIAVFGALNGLVFYFILDANQQTLR